MEPLMAMRGPNEATEPFERIVNYRTIVRITTARAWRFPTWIALRPMRFHARKDVQDLHNIQKFSRPAHRSESTGVNFAKSRKSTELLHSYNKKNHLSIYVEV
jgi:hypothetical protein